MFGIRTIDMISIFILTMSIVIAILVIISYVRLLRPKKFKPGSVIQITGGIYSGPYKLILSIPYSLSEVDKMMKELKAKMLKRRNQMEVAPVNDPSLTPAEAEKLKAMMEEKHRGLKHAGYQPASTGTGSPPKEQ
ncbi:hypothetical protein LCGC14_0895560 [marine sediment metagenome]|uniref:Uncharacterized protein n=1 Tax=marine sediment metagenome TaxID=412755 RepID=A0A0F9S4Y8_9ZZZZ